MSDNLHECYDAERSKGTIPRGVSFEDYVYRVKSGRHTRSCCGPYRGEPAGDSYGRSPGDYMIDPPMISGGVAYLTASEILARRTPAVPPEPACMNRKLLLTKR